MARTSKFPNPAEPCYDCGSTLPNRHTPLCEMAPKAAVRDLPQIEGTQYWTESAAGARLAAK